MTDPVVLKIFGKVESLGGITVEEVRRAIEGVPDDALFYTTRTDGNLGRTNVIVIGRVES